MDAYGSGDEAMSRTIVGEDAAPPPAPPTLSGGAAESLALPPPVCCWSTPDPLCSAAGAAAPGPPNPIPPATPGSTTVTNTPATPRVVSALASGRRDGPLPNNPWRAPRQPAGRSWAA